MLISIFQRQSTVLSLAYAHALILANRPALLSNFADLTKRTGLPSEAPSDSLKECITAAMIVVDTVTDLIEEKRMRHSFWFTHYISFCAISALYVYTIQNCLFHGRQGSSTPPDIDTFEAAKKCQRSIEETTTKTSPFRKYNIILDELKKEVLQHIGPQHTESAMFQSSSQLRAGDGQPPESIDHTLSQGSAERMVPSGNLALDSRHVSSTAEEFTHDASQHLELNLLQSQYYDVTQAAISGDQSYDAALANNSFPGVHDAMMGWSEFDSCVSEGISPALGTVCLGSANFIVKALTWPDAYGMLDQGYGL